MTSFCLLERFLKNIEKQSNQKEDFKKLFIFGKPAVIFWSVWIQSLVKLFIFRIIWIQKIEIELFVIDVVPLLCRKMQLTK